MRTRKRATVILAPGANMGQPRALISVSGPNFPEIDGAVCPIYGLRRKLKITELSDLFEHKRHHLSAPSTYLSAISIRYGS